MSYKIKKLYFSHEKTFKIVLFIIFMPILLYTLELIFDVLFNLGIYSGTFLRYLFNVVTK